MTASEADPGHHHTFIFDRTVTNIGGNYNHHTGIFTSTESGVYVFSWTVVCYQGSFISSQLIVNSDVQGAIVCRSIYQHPEYNFMNTASSAMVLQLNSGDVVYVRTHPTNSIIGQIYSGEQSRTSFTGWKII